MNNLADKITEKLEKENIKPTPKWQFLLKDYVLWVVFGINVLLGAVFFAIVLSSLGNNDWDIYKYLNQGFLEHIIRNMPYVRLTALGIFIFLSYYNYRYTDKGYKKKSRKIVLMGLVIIAIIGGTLAMFGRANILENVFKKAIPYYETVEEKRMKMWYHPEEGLLTGTIVKVDDGFVIEDYYKKRWLIDISKADWRGPVQEAQIGQQVKIIGKQLEVNKFKAEEIRPWNGNGWHRGRSNRG